MLLSTNSRLGPYEIRSVLGTGGMGEVYRARDTKLGREVALKILPESVESDPDRLGRFEREARMLASLNHPHIAQIYGLEDFGSTRVIVMELVEGENLHERLKRGPVPVSEALAIALQVAEALQAAHDAGIVHRDLKPANITVRPDGTTKVLDFGLAKMPGGAQDSTSGEVTAAPNLALTTPGVVMGTVAYMAPEQARGQAIDRRADMWAFGCVLYEMLTGRCAFAGGSSSDVIAHILTGEPDWSLLPPGLTAGVHRVLRRSLEKSVTKRLRDAGDARLDLEETSAATATRPVSWRSLAVAGVTVLGLASVIAGLSVRNAEVPSPAAAPVVRATVLLPPGHLFEPATRAVAVSADGQQILYSARDGLYIRRLDSFESRLIPGTTNAINSVFSPDGNRIAVWSLPGGVRVIDPLTGAATALQGPALEVGGILPSLSWDEHGLLASQGTSGAILFPPGSSEGRRLITPVQGEAVSSVQFLPGGRHLLMTVFDRSSSRPGSAVGQVVVQTLDSGLRVPVLESGSDARYVPSGHIVYAASGAIHAVRFDVASLRVQGEPAVIVEGVRATNVLNATTHFAVSGSGTLVYVPGQAMPPALALDLVQTSRDGAVRYLHLPPAPYEAPRVSPDGSRVAMSTDDGSEANVWIHDLAQPLAVRKLTLGGRNRFPVWSPDGRQIAFQSDRDGDVAIYAQAADGSDAARRLTTAEQGSTHTPESWSPTGTHLLFAVARDGVHRLRQLALSSGRVEPFADVVSGTPTAATFSPDGRWVAYTTMTGGGFHAVFVQPFPATGAIYQVSSNDDGHHPVWSRSGRELFYVPGPGRLAAVTVSANSSFMFSRPNVLPPAGLMGPGTIVRSHDILPDGSLFIGRQIAEDDESRRGAPPRIQILTSWPEDLRRRGH